MSRLKNLFAYAGLATMLSGAPASAGSIREHFPGTCTLSEKMGVKNGHRTIYVQHSFCDRAIDYNGDKIIATTVTEIRNGERLNYVVVAGKFLKREMRGGQYVSLVETIDDEKSRVAILKLLDDKTGRVLWD